MSIFSISSEICMDICFISCIWFLIFSISPDCSCILVLMSSAEQVISRLFLIFLLEVCSATTAVSAISFVAVMTLLMISFRFLLMILNASARLLNSFFEGSLISSFVKSPSATSLISFPSILIGFTILLTIHAQIPTLTTNIAINAVRAK